MRFRGRIALVTGSSRGIGRALAILLAREGAEVIVHYRRNAAAAERTLAEIRAAGGAAWSLAADVEDLAALEGMFAAVGERHGHLDIFVANAAATAFKPALEVRPHHLERTFNANVRAFVVGVQHAVGLMGPGGRILGLSSYGSVRAFPDYANLGASKAALEAWVRYFAEELGPRDINVNALNAGVVATDSADFFYGRPGLPSLASVAARIPKGRVASPEEIARAAAFLVSPDASYVTGSVLTVDGGLTLIAPPFRGDLAGG